MNAGVSIVENGGQNNLTLMKRKKMKFELMCDKVEQWYYTELPSEQCEFKNYEYENLWEYSHSLGRKIRNFFELWDNGWTPNILDGVDNSEDHPDVVSMRVIQEVWKRVQK